MVKILSKKTCKQVAYLTDIAIGKLIKKSEKYALNRHEYLQMLSGNGLEIGALHNPSPAPHLNVSYVDRLSVAELRQHYPELNTVPLVEPNILDNAEVLQNIIDNSQDFIIANHVIEHLANPILALHNWFRILKPGGRLFLAAPDKRFTFDLYRKITNFQHLLEDYHSPCKERDYQHFIDYALKVDGWYGKQFSASEAEKHAHTLWQKNYSIHYHVWDYSAFTSFLKNMKNSFPAWKMKIIHKIGGKWGEYIFILEKTL